VGQHSRAGLQYTFIIHASRSRLQVQAALEAAVAAVLGEAGEMDVRSAMRTGTLVTTDNRDWELRAGELQQRFKQCRAVGEQGVVGWG
jgi:hypothetical protein